MDVRHVAVVENVGVRMGKVEMPVAVVGGHLRKREMEVALHQQSKCP